MVRPKSLEARLQTFRVEYAMAMANWTQLESSLAHVFSQYTGLRPNMAYSLFFSVRTFDGRISLFKAGIPHSGLPKKYNPVLKAFANKARAIAEHRNSLAHDHFDIDTNPESPTRGELLLIDGKYQFQDKQTKLNAARAALTTRDFKSLQKTFCRLRDVLDDFWRSAFHNQLKQPSKYLHRLKTIRRLPLPRPEAPSPAKSKRKR
jgi:hypothetical protein